MGIYLSADIETLRKTLRIICVIMNRNIITVISLESEAMLFKKWGREQERGGNLSKRK